MWQNYGFGLVNISTVIGDVLEMFVFIRDYVIVFLDVEVFQTFWQIVDFPNQTIVSTIKFSFEFKIIKTQTGIK